MSILKNRHAAVLISVLMCVLALFFGSWRSASSLKWKLSDEFTKADKSGHSMKNDLADKADMVYSQGAAATVCSIYEKYNPDKDTLSKLQTDAENLKKTKDAEKAYQYSSNLTALSKQVYNDLKSKMKESDEKAMKKIIANLTAIDDIVNRGANVYNAKVDDANEKLGKFPIRVFCELFGFDMILGFGR